MPLELWFAFSLTSIVLLVVPGPTVMLVFSYALGHGKRTAWATVPGVALGDFTAMTISLAGAGAVLAASATLFAILKYVGAAYLIWLGIKLWRAEPRLEQPGDALPETELGVKDRRSMFWSAYVVTALNPKSIVFFIAFLPQFVAPAQPVLPQFVILGATFLVLATVSSAIWALAAGAMRAGFRKPRTLKLANRFGGGFMIGAGLLTAAVRRV
ncbi:LysE family translocator [Pelagibius sp. Alg239-R121]|uniref:LysE family translocator n=1 Tax=Pelagibius sp. Alg239-R121 TaxID=2993448 RepID=UPI0024A73BDD|nr:LysE family translocator [Pelagibius sp. Alg239-R121]